MLESICPNANPSELRKILCASSKQEVLPYIKKYPAFLMAMNEPNPVIAKELGYQSGIDERIRDLDCITMVAAWSRNKQVYKFDKDFMDELINTETLQSTKDMFEYLPYQYMYIDISDCEEACEAIQGQGFFVTVSRRSVESTQKAAEEEKADIYYIHLCKISQDGEMFFNDIFAYENEDKEYAVNDLFEESQTVNTFDGGAKDYQVKKISFNPQLYNVIVFQMLSYLSSVEPDIRENDTTKETYRKPTEGFKPKNKFSEIQAWDVGVRFGNAFRKWTEQKQHGGTTGTGMKKRPHSRRAHWSHYWYGKKDGGERVCRAKWISEMFINADKGKDGVVIHKPQKERDE